MRLVYKIFIAKTLLLCAYLFLPALSVMAEIRLPRLISDGMVLQRNEELKIWGWALPSEPIELNFRGNKYQTKVDSEGCWHILLPPQQAGGPYTMIINDYTINDILIGDVWLCSGQSNMEIPMLRVMDLYKNEIDSIHNPFIRHFKVPLKYSFAQQEDDQAGGHWQSATQPDILSISAVAYFFASELYDEYKVPIGLLNASVGGSPVEAWMSEDAFQKAPHYLDMVSIYAQKGYIDSVQHAEYEQQLLWYNTLNRNDAGKQYPEFWSNPEVNTSDWKTMNVPGYWSDNQLGNVNGSVWFRRDFDLPPDMVDKAAIIRLGCIVDCDSVYINGQFIGTTAYQYPPRIYKIPNGLFKEGKNSITIRIINTMGRGGFVEDKPYKIITENNEIDLQGKWFYKLGIAMPALTSFTSFQNKPTGLYNGMIAPLIDYKVKGIIWYQGESNTNRADEYEMLFTSLIEDWRHKWDVPFLYVQLPNFMKADSIPSSSNWARLREAQLKTLKLPDTGMAVAIDLGEWNDIHPLNKKDVSYRLSLLAKKLAYGSQDIVSSGPLFQSMQIDENRIIISFTEIGSGLITNGDKLKGFAISGSDRQFVWANATIENGNKVIVWHDDVRHPIAVRYGWANNPEDANLRNKEGLPASPFRTDEWK